MIRVLRSDLLKIRKKMIWFLIFLGPIGVIGLEAANFGIRYDYLTAQYADDLWRGLIDNIRFLSIPTLFIGLTILISMIANIEHQTNSWKQLLALPITKRSVFTGKFLLASSLLFISCTLLEIGTVILGIVLKFGTEIPFIYLTKVTYLPFLAVMPFIALHIWLSIMVKNQAIPLTIGIVGTIVSMYSVKFPDWVPYKWPLLENDWGGSIYSVLAGLITGFLIYTLGLLDFTRKDVS